MFVLLILCAVVAAVAVLYWFAERSVTLWNCKDLSKKAVLITGCDVNEIALELAFLLDKNGVPVFACYSDETNADDIRQSVSSNLRILILDVKNADSIQKAVEAVKRHLPSSAVLWGVVNASVESRAAGLPAELYSMDDDYRALLDANLLSAAAVTSAFLPLLVASRGRVINTGCLTGLVNIPANAAYSASMSALLAWSESLRREKASAGVVVSTVIPGAVRNTGNHTDRIWSQLKSRYNAASDELHTIYRLDEYMYFVGRALLRSENRRKLLPEVVAAAYAHALFARRPRPVYLVGADALLAAVIGCLPRWLQDRLLPVFFHYPRPPPRRDLPEVETHG